MDDFKAIIIYRNKFGDLNAKEVAAPSFVRGRFSATDEEVALKFLDENKGAEIMLYTILRNDRSKPSVVFQPTITVAPPVTPKRTVTWDAVHTKMVTV